MPKNADKKHAVKVAVKKAVKKAERKIHGGKRKQINRAGNRIVKSTPASLQNRLAQLAVGASNERKAATELAKALCAPNMYPSFGVQDGYSSMPTASSSPFMCHPASPAVGDGSTADSNGIPYDESCAIATRDPRCALRYYDGTNRTYSYIIVDNEGNQTRDLAVGDHIDIREAVVDVGVTVTAVHGTKLYAGSTKEGPASGETLLLGQQNQTLTVNGLGADASTSVAIWVLEGNEWNLYRCAKASSGGSWSANLSEFARAGDSTYTLDTKFFYWGKLSCGRALTDGMVSITGTGIPTLCQLPLAGFGEVAALVDKLRFCSLNLMYSNTSPALSKQGFVCGWQVPSDKDPFTIFRGGFEALANEPGAERLIADQGIHGFWKSTDPLDWEYLEVSGDTAEGESGYYEIDSDSDYLMIMTKIPQAAGRAGYWTVFSDVQYRHDSVWFPTGYPNHDRRTFEDALEIQGRVPQWHCNPFHIKDIFKWIGQHKGQIQKSISMGAGMIGPQAEGYANRANSFLDIWFK